MNENESYDLGASKGQFKPSAANKFAGVIFALLLLGGSIFAFSEIGREVYASGGNLPISAKKGMSWIMVGFGSLLGLMLTVGGVFFAFFARKLFSRNLEIFDKGFLFQQRNETSRIVWEDVVIIRETILYETPPILKGAAKHVLPKVTSRSYDIITADDREFDFNGTTVKQIDRLGALLSDIAHRDKIEWQTVEDHS